MKDKDINDVDIKDSKGSSLPWSYIFFILHKHCNLSKWEIYDYTLPQVSELMQESKKYIEFEVSTRIPMPLLGGGGGGGNDGYHEATEEDINALTKFLGG
jgi:hypothetical protein